MNKMRNKTKLTAIIGLVVAFAIVLFGARSMFADNETDTIETKTHEVNENTQEGVELNKPEDESATNEGTAEVTGDDSTSDNNDETIPSSDNKKTNETNDENNKKDNTKNEPKKSPRLSNFPNQVVQELADGVTLNYYSIANGSDSYVGAGSSIKIYMNAGEKVKIDIKYSGAQGNTGKEKAGDYKLITPSGSTTSTPYPLGETSSGQDVKPDPIDGHRVMNLTASETGVYILKSVRNNTQHKMSVHSLTFKVSKGTGAHIKGRVWTNSFSLQQPTVIVNNTVINPKTLASMKLYYTTYDGYIYETVMENFNGWSSRFFSDPVGVVYKNGGNCSSAYQSTPANDTTYAIGENVSACKDKSQENNTFFENPSSDLPKSIDINQLSSKGAVTGKKNLHVKQNLEEMTPSFSNVSFNQDVNTSTIMSGDITFDSTNFTGNVDIKLTIDRNRDGVVDSERMITTLVKTNGQTLVKWDGKDGTGSNVNKTAIVNAKLIVKRRGEIHTPMYDIEEGGGIKMRALTEMNPGYKLSDLVEYDDGNIQLDYAGSPNCDVPKPLKGTYKSYSSPAYKRAWKFKGPGACNFLSSYPSNPADAGQRNSFGDYKYMDQWMYENVDLSTPEYPLNEPLIVGLKSAKDADNDGKANHGDTLKYTVNAYNKNPKKAIAVNLEDSFNDPKFSNAKITALKATKYRPNGTVEWVANKGDTGITVNDAIKPYFKVAAGDMENNARVLIEIDLKMSIKYVSGPTLDNQVTGKGTNTDTGKSTSEPNPSRPNEPNYFDPNKPENFLPEKVTTIPTVSPKLVGVKTVVDESKNGKFEPGERLDYTMFFTNMGTGPTNNIVIKDLLADSEFAGALVTNATVTVNGKTITGNIKSGINIGDLKANEFAKVTFSVTLAKPIASSDGIIKNQATATADNIIEIKTHSKTSPANPQLPLDPNGTPTETTIEGKIEIKGTKNVVDNNKDGIAVPGEKLSYTITATNSSVAAVKDIPIKDPLTNVITNIDNGATPANIPVKLVFDKDPTKNKTINAANLQAGIKVNFAGYEKVTITFDVNVKANLATETVKKITNQVLVNEVPINAEIPTGKVVIEKSKTVKDANNDGKAAPGEKLSYTLSAKNSGTALSNNFDFKDELKELLPHINENAASIVVKVKSDKNTSKDATLAGTQLIAGIKRDLAAGETITVTFDVTVRSDLNTTSVTQIKNTATTGSTTTPTGKPAVSGTKDVTDTNGDNLASPGEELNYVITASNTGSAKANQVEIKDTLSNVIPNITKGTADIDVSVKFTKEPSRNTTIKATALVAGVKYDLAAGETVTLAFKVTVKTDLNTTTVTKIANQALVAGTPINKEIPTGSPGIGGTKEVNDTTGDNIASPGETLKYKIIAVNKGKATANNVIIKDPLTNIKNYIVDGNIPANISIKVKSNKETAKNKTLTLADLISGLKYNMVANEEIEVTFDVVLLTNLDVTSVTKLMNTATVNDVPAKAEIPTGKAIISGDKSVKDADNDDKAAPGEELTYTLTANNTGNATANKVEIKDTLSTVLPHITKTAGDIDVDVKSTTPSKNKTVKASALVAGLEFDLEAGEKITITFKVTVRTDLNTVTVTKIANQALVNKVPINKEIPTGKPELEQSKKVEDTNKDGKASPGEELSYTLTSKNKGTAVANKVSIKDDLKDVLPHVDKDKNTIVIEVKSDKDNSKNKILTAAELIAGLEFKINQGETITVSFKVTVKAGLNTESIKEIKNIATTGSTTIPTGKPIVNGTKEVKDTNKDGVATPGEELTYTLTANNTGNAKANKIAIKDDLANVLPHVDSDANTIEIEIKSNIDSAKNKKLKVKDLIAGLEYDLVAGEKVTVTFKVTVKAGLDTGTVTKIANTAVINKVPITEEIPTGKPGVGGTKKVEDASKDGVATPGELLSYTITAKNAGNATANNVLVQDKLEGVLQFVVNGSNPSAIDVIVESNKDIAKNKTIKANQLVAGLRYDMIANEEITFKFSVKLNDGINVQAVTAIANTATVGPTNPTASIPTGIEDIISSKDVKDANNDGKAVAGEDLSYKITASNTGTARANQVEIKDTLVNVLPNIKNGANPSIIPVEVKFTKDPSKNKTITAADLVNGVKYDIDAGETITVTFTVTIIDDLKVPPVDKIANKAVVGKTNPETEIPTGKVELDQSKAVKDANNDGKAAPGEKLSYTLTAHNKGTAKANQVEFKDELTNVLPHIDEDAAGISVKIASTKDISRNKTVTATELIAGFKYDLVADEKITITFDVTVKSDLDPETVKEIANIATTGTTTIPTGKPKVSGTKDVTDTNGDNLASPGEELNYEITASNTGAATANQVEIKDTLVNVIPHITKTAGDINVEVKFAKVPSKNTTIKASALVAGVKYDLTSNETVTLTFKVKLKDDLQTATVTKIANQAVVNGEPIDKEILTGAPGIGGTKEVEDTTGDDIASPGETLKYKIIAVNKGKATANNVIIKDTLSGILPHIVDGNNPSNINVKIESNKDTTKNKIVTLENLISGLKYDMVADEEIKLTFDVVLLTNFNTVDITTLINTATINDVPAKAEIPTGKVNIIGNKDVRDTDNDGKAAPGEELTYTLTANNTGNATANKVEIKDALTNVLPHVTKTAGDIDVDIKSNINSSKNTTVKASDLIAGLEFDLEAGEMITVTFNVTIIDNLNTTMVTKIANKALINKVPVEKEIPTGKAELELSKAVADANNDEKAAPGEELTYTLSAKNNGTAIANKVSINDELKDVLPHVDKGDAPDTIAIEVKFDKNPSKNTTLSAAELIAGLEYDLAQDEKVTVTFKVTVKANLNVDDITEIKNIATTGTTTTETGKPIVNGTKDVKDTNKDGVATPGEELTYTLVAFNSGSATANKVGIKDDLNGVLPHVDSDANTIEIEVKSNVDSTKNKKLKAKDLIAGLEYDLVAGEKVTVTFKVTVKTGLDTTLVTVIKNIATIGEEKPEKEIPTGKPGVGGTKKVEDASKDEIAAPGEKLSYTITAKNAGTATANNVLVQDKLEGVLSFVVNGKNPSAIDVNVESNKDPAKNKTIKVSELIAGLRYDMVADEEITFKFEVTLNDDLDVKTTTAINNIATVGPTNPSASIPTGKAIIDSAKDVKDANNDEKASPGEELSYKITASNTGSARANKVEIKDTLANVLLHVKDGAKPDLITVEMKSDKDSSKDATITATELIAGLYVDIDGGETITVTFKVTVKDDLDTENVKKIANKAVVGKTEPEIEIETGKADLEQSKNVGDANNDGKAAPGEKLSYTLVAHNKGNAKANQVEFKDELTNVLPHIDEDAAGISVKIASTKDLSRNKTVTATELIAGFKYDLVADEKITITFDVTVKSDLDPETVKEIANIATTGTTTIPTGKPKVSGTKDVTDTNGDNLASPGEELNYEITASNTGAATANQVEIKDTLVNVIPHITKTAGDINVEVKFAKDPSKNTTIKASALVAGVKYDLTSNETVTLTFKVKLKDDLQTAIVTKIANQAVVNGDPIDKEIPTGAPGVGGTKEVTDTNGDNIASPGEKLSYKIIAVNKGTATANDVIVKDLLSGVLPHIIDGNNPANINVEIESNKDASKSKIVTLADLNAGLKYNMVANEEITIKFDVVLKTNIDLTSVTKLINTATINDVPAKAEIPTGKVNIIGNKDVRDTDNDGKAAPGEELTYTLTANNTGNATANKVEIKDALTNVLPHVTKTAGDIDVDIKSNINSSKNTTVKASDLIAGLEFDLEAGEMITVTFNVTIIDNLNTTMVTKIANTAVINKVPIDKEIPTGKADLALNKTVADANNDKKAAPGEELTYTLSAKNNGTAIANKVSIKDELKDVLPHVDKGDAPSTIAIEVKFDRDPSKNTTLSAAELIAGLEYDLAQDETVTVTFKVTVKANLNVDDITEIKNIATTGTTTTETGKPIIKGTKEVEDTNKDGIATPGEELTYTLVANNTGSATANKVAIQDDLADVLPHVDSDANTIEIEVKSNVDSTKDKKLKAKDLIAGLEYDLVAGEKVTVTFKVTVKADLDTGLVTKITNIATIGEEKPEKEIPTGKPGVGGTKKVEDANGDNIAAPGEELSYTIIAKNAGTATANNVLVQDKLEGVLSFVVNGNNPNAIDVKVESNKDPAKNKTIKASELVAGLRYDMVADEEITFKFEVTLNDNLNVKDITAIINTAIVGPTNPSANIPTGKAIIDSAKDVKDANNDEKASPGEELSYKITASNTGSARANQVEIKDTLANVLPNIKDGANPSVIPVEVKFTKDSSKDETITAADLVNGIAYDMEAGETITVTFKVTVKDDLDTEKVKKIANKAVVGKTEPEIEIETGKADLEQSKNVEDANNDGKAAPGEVLSYTLTAHNKGNAKANQVEFKDELTKVLPNIDEDAAGISVKIASTKDASRNKTVTATELIAGFKYDLVVDEKITITFDVTIKSDLDPETVKEIANIATTGTTTIPTGKPKVSGTKDVTDTNGDNLASPGEELNYEITASNTGAATANQVEIKDTLVNVLPHITKTAGDINVEVKFAKDTSKNTTIKASALVAGVKYDLTANETVTLTFKVKLKDDLQTATVTKIANQVLVNGDPIDKEIPTGAPGVGGTKEVTDTNGDNIASPGEKLSYKIIAVNKGTATANDVIVKDTLSGVLPHIIDGNNPANINVEIESNKDTSKNKTVTLADLNAGLKYNMVADEEITIKFDVTLKTNIDLTSVTKLINTATINDVPAKADIPTGKVNIIGNKDVRDTDNDGKAAPGEELTYTLTANNTGNATANKVEIKDALTNVLPHVTKTAGDIDVDIKSNINSSKDTTVKASDLIAGLEFDLETGEKITVTFKVTIIDNLNTTTVTKIANTAVINKVPIAKEIPTGKADLALNKTVADANNDKKAAPGEELTYTLTAKNNGTAIANKVSIKDELKDVLPHVDKGDVPSTIAIEVKFDKDPSKNTTLSAAELITGLEYDLVQGETVTVTFKVTVKANLDVDDITEIKNIATTGTTTTETGKPIIKGTKEVEDTNKDGIATPGEELTYTLVANNTGSATANKVAIQDDLADVLPHVDSDANTIDVIVKSNMDSAKDKTLKAKDLIAGLEYDLVAGEKIAVTFKVIVKANLDTGLVTKITNIATIGEEKPEKEIPTGKPGVGGTKKVEDANGDNIAAPGEELSYTITAKNAGTATANNVLVQDKLEGVLSFVVNGNNPNAIDVKVESNKDLAKNKTIKASELVAGLRYDMVADEEITFKFTVTLNDNLNVKDITAIINTAIVGPTNPSANIPTGKAIIDSAKDVKDANNDEKASPGEELSYKITASNTGSARANQVEIKDTLANVLPNIKDGANPSVIPVEVKFTKDSSKDETITAADLVNGIAYDMEAGETITVTFKVTVKDDLDTEKVKKIANKAVVGKTEPEIEIETGKADLEQSKNVEDANNDGKAAPGEVLSYTLTAHNKGNAKANQVEFKDELTNVLPNIDEDAAGISVKIASTKDASRNKTVTATELIAGFKYDLVVDEKITITFDVTVKSDLDPETVKEIANIATTGTTTIPTGKPKVSGTKDVTDTNGDNLASPKEVLNYIITASNTGTAKANQVEIKDDLVNVLPNITSSASNIDVEVISNKDSSKNKTIKASALVAGVKYDILEDETITFTFKVTLKDNLDTTTVTKIANQVIVNGDPIDAEIPTGAPGVGGTKKVEDANNDKKAAPGEKLQYTITAKNAGTAIANNVIIKDTLSSLLSHIKNGENPASIVVEIQSSDTSKNRITSATELISGLKFDMIKDEEITITFDVIVKDDLDVINVTSLINTATINDKPAKAEIPTGKANINGYKRVEDANNDGKAAPGEELTYTITAKNTGNATANKVKVKDELTNVVDNIVNGTNPSAIDVIVKSNKDTAKDQTIGLDELISGLEYDLVENEEITLTFVVTVKDGINTSVVTEIANKAVVGPKEPEVTIPTGKAIINGTKQVEDANKDDKAAPGEELKYTITASNTGTAVANKVLVKDDLVNVIASVKKGDAPSTIAVEVNSNKDSSKNTTISAAELIAGIEYDLAQDEIVTLVFRVTVKDDLDVNSVISIANKAVVGDKTPEAIINTGKATIEATKEVEDANKDGLATPKETLTYTITAKNTGNATANDVEIKDTLNKVLPHIEDGKVLTKIDLDISSDKDGSKNRTTSLNELVSGLKYNMVAGETITISFDVKIKADLEVNAITELYNKAIVGDKTPEATIETGAPDIKASKTVKDTNGDDIAAPKEKITYTITARNDGKATANDVLVQDELKGILPFVTNGTTPTTIDVEVTSTKDPSKNKIVSLADLVAGMKYNIVNDEVITFTFDVVLKDDVNIKEVTSLVNRAVVGDKTPTASIPTGKEDLVATKSVKDTDGDNIAAPEEELTYTITAKNKGTAVASNVIIQDKLDKVLPHIDKNASDIEVRVTSDKDTSKNTLITGDDLVAGVEYEIKMGETITLTFKVKIDKDLDVNAIKELINTVTVKGIEKDAKIPTGKPHVEGSKTVNDENNDDFASPNEKLTYTITAKNIGTAQANDVKIQDSLGEILPQLKDGTKPENIKVIVHSNKDNTKTNVTALELINELNYKLAIDEVVTLTFEVRLKDDFDTDKFSMITNKATVGPKEPIAEIKTGRAKLTATKIVEDCNGDGTVENGEELSYKIYIRNIGEVTARNVKIQDLLDDTEFNGATLKGVTIKNNNDLVGKNIDITKEFNAQDLLAGKLIEIEFSIIMKTPIEIADKIASNQAFVSADNHKKINTTNDVVPGDDTTPGADLNIPTEIEVRNPKLVATKVVQDSTGDGTVENGETLKYTMYYTNVGDLAARKVVIRDLLSDEEFKNAKISSAKVVKGTSTYSGDIRTGISIGELAAGEKTVVEFIVTMANPISMTGKTPNLVVNQAYIKGENTPEVITTSNVDPKDPSISLDGEGQDPAPTVIGKENPYLTGTKLVKDTSGDGKFEAKEKIHYTLHFRNMGKAPARNVFVKDPLSDAEFSGAKIGQATATNGSAKYTGNIKTGFVVGDIASNGLVTVKFTVTMPKTIAKDSKTPGVLVNQAWAQGSNSNKALTTSDVNPNDPTKPRKPGEPGIDTSIKVNVKGSKAKKSGHGLPVTGNESIAPILITGLISIIGLGYIKKRKSVL